jgi:hypothetical protein
MKDMDMMERVRPGSSNINLRRTIPHVGLSEIKAAASALVARHDAMRLRIDREASKATIADDCDPEVVVAEGPEDVEQHTRRPIAADADTPNLRVVVNKHAPSGRTMTLVVPHAFADAHSFALVYEELQGLLTDPSEADRPASVGFSDFAAKLCELHDAPSASTLEFWKGQLGSLEPVPKGLLSAERDPGYVDIVVGSKETISAIRQRLKLTEFVLLISLFAHGLQHIFDGQDVPCRLAFLGRRSRPQMAAFGCFAEYPLLKFGAAEANLADGSLQASILRLLTAPQPRQPLQAELPPRARLGLRRPIAVFQDAFQDARHYFSHEELQVFWDDNPHLCMGELPPPAGELEFVSTDSVALLGFEYPVRGEVIHDRSDGLVYLRIMTSNVDRQRTLGAASAVQRRVSEIA